MQPICFERQAPACVGPCRMGRPGGNIGLNHIGYGTLPILVLN